MRHCESCGFFATRGYEYPESYCSVGVKDDDPIFDEDAKGCGCHYNLRTLRKMQRENDRAEYLCYLGYDDYTLMPTMEYTEENEKILEQHRGLMRHALGMGHRKSYTRHGKKFYRPYRNYFETHEKAPDFPFWERLLKADLAKRKDRGENIWYFVTRRGMDWLGNHDGVHIYDAEK